MKSVFLGLLVVFSVRVFAQVNPWPTPGVDNSLPAAAPAQGQMNPGGLTVPAQPIPPPNLSGDSSTNSNNQTMNSLAQFLQSLNSGPGGVGGFGSFPGFGQNTGIDAGNQPFTRQVPGSGKLEACGNIAQGSSVAKARDEAIKFRNECAIAQRGDSQKIAINDYSAGQTPYMYIFDVNGNCLHKTAVSYGNGAGPVRPMPCSRGGSNLTPPGIHITAPHKNGSVYNESNSTLLVGLEGQESAGRGILIHYARSPGTASSLGCSGVGPYDQVRKILGYGSLVYNYFGGTGNPGGCGNSSGMGPPKPSSCRMDRAATPVPTFSTSSPATAR